LFLQSLGVRSLLDVPCGDFHWLSEVALGVESYVGVDLVEALVERCQNIYGDARRRFLCADAMTAALPRADLILCRDLLTHYPAAAVKDAPRSFIDSAAEYLLTTTYTAHVANEEIAAGGWRPINLCAPPFNLSPQLRALVEGCTEMGGRVADKSLGLWRLSDLAVP
jgi:hypothetical protein